jgi:hypothetical protein
MCIMSTTHSSSGGAPKEVPEERELVVAQAADVSGTAQRSTSSRAAKRAGPAWNA